MAKPDCGVKLDARIALAGPALEKPAENPPKPPGCRSSDNLPIFTRCGLHHLRLSISDAADRKMMRKQSARARPWPVRRYPGAPRPNPQHNHATQQKVERAGGIEPPTFSLGS